MIEVKVIKGNLEGALRKFKKDVFRAGVIQESRDRGYYQKPSRKKYERERKSLFMSRLRERQNNY
jgi:ribosomal protein S21|tara:strand:- start:2201 stop:2395 length:195 start_codon:yes stop_codon:yes gene_type:complete